jgi:hypothetical protein
MGPRRRVAVTVRRRRAEEKRHCHACSGPPLCALADDVCARCRLAGRLIWVMGPCRRSPNTVLRRRGEEKRHCNLCPGPPLSALANEVCARCRSACRPIPPMVPRLRAVTTVRRRSAELKVDGHCARVELSEFTTAVASDGRDMRRDATARSSRGSAQLNEEFRGAIHCARSPKVAPRPALV